MKMEIEITIKLDPNQLDLLKRMVTEVARQKEPKEEKKE